MGAHSDFLTAYIRMRLEALRRESEKTRAGKGAFADFAAIAKLTRSHVSQVASGNHGVGMKTMPKYATGLRMTPEELLKEAERWWREEGQRLSKPKLPVDAELAAAIKMLVDRGQSSQDDLIELAGKNRGPFFEDRSRFWWANTLGEMLERSRQSREMEVVERAPRAPRTSDAITTRPPRLPNDNPPKRRAAASQ